MQNFQILLVEDNRADALFVEEAFKQSKLNVRMNIVEDGDEALEYLNHRGKFKNEATPDIILLDLNLPRVDGHSVLTRIKNDPALKRIPVVILTSSMAPADISKSYDNHANAYIVKPVGLSQMMQTVAIIEDFWFKLAKPAPKDPLLNS